MMHDEVVQRRRWIDDERFVDLVGATNLIPGPNSTELAIHLGWERGRGRGLILAGVAFILPASLIVGALAWAYVEYGETPAIEGLLYGIKPAVIAIVAQALLAIIPNAGGSPLRATVLVLAGAGYLLGLNELALLVAGGAVLAAAAQIARWRERRGPGAGDPGVRGLLPILAAAPVADVDRLRLFWTFLKIGSVLYGSGYVLLAFLQGELVERLGWLTSDQLLDAVSIGQVTPGPVFTTATFVGYLVGGFWGAVLATVGIFLPSFVFVALLTRVVRWMRASATFGAVLDGVNAAAVGLMAAVSLVLARDAIVDLLTAAVAAAAGLALWRTSLNSAWLIGAGAAVGLAHAWIT
jgi:chromate transporter